MYHKLMTTHSPRLNDLISRLDDLGRDATLAGIAESLTTAALTAEDVAPFVRSNPAMYHRARVVQRGHYELLVMTWLPGQASEPHDHTGAVCALQVIRGAAVEGEYSVAPDGFADLEYESLVRTGQVTAGQDGGVHTVRNPSASDLLVTVHVYAPPLGEVRRYTCRPGSSVPRPRSDGPTALVVGAGFSGTMTAAHLLRCAPQLNVVLAERRGSLGEGVAYGTRDAAHLLNVPAARMSAWPDRPTDFLEWARRRDPAVHPTDFLPRQWYGDYLRDTLRSTARQSRGRLDLILGEVRRVARHPDGGWMAHFDHGPSFRADVVVLAIGHRPPSDPLRGVWAGPRDRFIPDPWRPFAVGTVPADEPVAILGSGLTAVDTVLSLCQTPRSAPITLISRKGLLPHAHATAPVTPQDLAAFVNELLGTGPSPRAAALSCGIHRRARKLIADGGDWRSVVDGLRPHTARLWQALSPSERSRFLSRLRPFWEAHRHRMAPQVADRLAELRRSGLVELVAGQVVGTQASPDNVRLDIAPRRGGPLVSRAVGWVINCTGPAPSNRPEANPVIGSLLIHGWLTRDELSLGLEVAPDGQAVGANGTAVTDLFVVGTLRKPQTWESTAVPELRLQAADVAARIANRYPADVGL
ncbi:hypothetical protein FTUN_8139 [Frigoriglobus tundricola]|uniref:FAD-dependent urate hydroxylase HpyO/Asp monooxygenase CreE-like FAD/NAD(P)-binding domain-containing protein n=2 Tax=Frigoriglobus tundricola TaxID=2774151 RepID=A0A6M5Z2P0_9BACT|nr:hypothetical protein FTUN_8139 [Frigoriglobus tundricola]